MSSDIFDDFATEPGGMGSGTVRVGDILARGVPLRWDEAVALLQEILETVIAAEGPNPTFPAFEDIVIDRDGAVGVLSTRRGERGPVAAGRALHALLATADVPLPLRLFVTQANAPETHKSLKAFAEALGYFGKPGRGDLIRAVYERHRSTAPSTPVVSSPGRPGAPPPLSQAAARREQALESRRAVPPWLMPAGIVVCIVSLFAVIWFGLLGGSNSAAASTSAEANAAVAEAPPTTKDGRPASRTAERGSAATGRGGQQTPAADRPGRRDAARSSLFDPSTTRLTEPPLRVAQLPDEPAADATKAAVPVIPSSREYVIAPRESTGTTIYSSADTDVQPPILMYPSLPSPIFVARNADALVFNRMELVVAPDGSVERVRLVNGPTRMPDMMLLSGAKLWKFSPATRNGEAVRYRAIVTWSGFP